MQNELLYQKYHSKIKLQKRIISENDFTYRNIIESLADMISKNKYLLDIGSATGTLSFYFASKGVIVDGVELSKNAYRFAIFNRENLKIKNVKFINTSIENYKTNKKYDFVTCFEVLEHLEDDVLILNKINTFMKPKAILIVSVPSKNAPLYRLGLLNKFDSKVGHLRRYSVDEIKVKLNKAKYQVIREFKCEGVVRNLIFTNTFFSPLVRLARLSLVNYIITKFDDISLKIFGESQIILVCKKK